jgi:microcystin degradation protein MlrC
MSGIAVGGFLHETNTFAPTKATYAAFVHGGGWPSMSVVRNKATRAATGTICDPDAAAAAHGAGVGATIKIALGGKIEDQGRRPLRGDVRG